MTHKEIALTKLYEAMELQIDPSDLSRYQVDVKEIYGYLLVKFQKESWADRIQEKVTIKFDYEVPANWWQHLKQSYFPEFLLRRFPVIKTKHYFTSDVYWDRSVILEDIRHCYPSYTGKIILRDNHSVYTKPFD